MFVNFGNRNGGIDPPFGLKWGISFNDIGKLVEQGKSNIEGFYADKIDSSVCEHITRAVLVGEYLNQTKFANLYFWNDSLFEVSFFLSSSLDTFVEVMDFIVIDSIPSTDTLNDSGAKVVKITDSIVKLIDENIKAMNNFKNNIRKVVVDTSYRESKHHYFPDKVIRDESISYFGYNNTSIVLKILSYEDKLDSTCRSGEYEFLPIFFRSDNYNDISEKFKKWKEETGINFNWYYPSKGYFR